MANYRIGSRGSDVEELQRLLNQNGANLTVDGIYGRGTDTAVRNYQRSKGLSVDGIAGANTFASLRGTSGTGSAPVQTAAQKLSAFDATKPQAYQSNYQDQINALLNQIQNRPKFSYDFASDPLYNQYAQRYQQLGKMAMEDTMGQSAALTGGYGNSYAQTAGQQQYNQYMQGLNDVIPELRNSAYQMYNDEGDDMARRLSLYQQQEGTDYDRYMDAYNQWQNERNYLYQLAQDEEEKRRWEAEYALSQQQARASRSSGGGGGGGGGSDVKLWTNAQFKTKWKAVQAAMKSGGRSLDSIRRYVVDWYNENAQHMREEDKTTFWTDWQNSSGGTGANGYSWYTEGKRKK